MGGDSKGSPELSLDDERRIMAILATAYGRPLQAHVLDKMRRAAELWNGGDKALAHIHLAFAGLPPCDDMDWRFVSSSPMNSSKLGHHPQH